MTVRKARFVGNPWSALDHKGRPSGYYPIAGAFGQYVGVSVDATATKQLHGADPAAGIEPEWDLVWKFSTEPVEVPLIGAEAAHYLQGVRSGDIFPADAATSRACGQKTFVPPAQAIEAAKKAALERWTLNYGEPPQGAEHAAPAAPKKSEKPTGGGDL